MLLMQAPVYNPYFSTLYIMFVSVSTVSLESYFSLTGRIIKERQRRLLPETVEMLACIKDWELGERRLQHVIDNPSRIFILMKMHLGLLLLAYLGLLLLAYLGLPHLDLHLWLLLVLSV